MGNGPEIIHF